MTHFILSPVTAVIISATARSLHTSVRCKMSSVSIFLENGKNKSINHELHYVGITRSH